MSKLPPRERLAISEITTKKWDFDADVREYERLGVALGLWRYKVDAYGHERAVALLREHPTKVTQMIDAGPLDHPAGEERNRCVADAIAAMKLAAALDCNLLLVGVRRLQGRSFEEGLEAAAETLRTILPASEDTGVRLALEPIHISHSDFLTTCDRALQLIQLAGNHPNVGLVIDTCHVWQDPQMRQQIAAAGPRIFSVHIADLPAHPEAKNDRVVMGDGVIPLGEIVQAIEATGYSGYYDVEIFSERLWASDYQSLIRRCQERFAVLFAE